MAGADETSEAHVAPDVPPLAAVMSERQANPLRVGAPIPRVWLTRPDDDGTIPLAVTQGMTPEDVHGLAREIDGRRPITRILAFDDSVDVRWLDDAITEARAIATEGALTELAELADVEVRTL